MDVKEFIEKYHEAFSARAELPVAIWYSDTDDGDKVKTSGCMFKVMEQVRSGSAVAFDADSLGCRGGKFYCGFTPMNPYMPKLVSEIERYKDSPESITDWLAQEQVLAASGKYLHFARIDQLKSFDGVEGLVFFATPDVMSGLCAWAFYDNNDPSAVTVRFWSGCGSIISQLVAENRRGGRRVMLGLTDISARRYFEAGIMSVAIPMSRMTEMWNTMSWCFLIGEHRDWKYIRERIGGSSSDC